MSPPRWQVIRALLVELTEGARFKIFLPRFRELRIAFKELFFGEWILDRGGGVWRAWVIEFDEVSVLGRRLCMDLCGTRLLRYKLVDVGEICQICERGASKY